MTYQELRQVAMTGDVLLVRGNLLVRMLTAESYSHVALLLWEEQGGLWVYEFVEGKGYQSMPASQWFAARRGQEIYHGEAPETVHAMPWQVVTAARAYRDRRFAKRYGWLSLAKVWISQLIGCRVPVRMRVCSTFVQECWEAAGYDGLKRTADPGDIAMECDTLHRIDYQEAA